MAASVALLVAGCGADTKVADHPSTTSAPPTPAPTTVDLGTIDGVPLALSGLTQGEPPAAWIQGNAFHRGDTTVTVGPGRWPEDTAPLVFAFGSGALRYDDPEGRVGSEVNVLDATSAVTYAAPATLPVRSPDGRQVAWWEPQTHEVVVGDAGTGELRRLPAPAPSSGLGPKLSWRVSVVGWISGDDVLVRGPAPRGESEEFWRTSGKAAPAWTSMRYAGMSPEAGIALVEDYPYVGTTDVDANCLAAVDLETSEQVWRHCYRHGDQPYPALMPVFSPDGRHLLLASVSITTGDPGYELVLDASDGRVLTKLELGRYEGDEFGFEEEFWTPVFEDGQHVLAVLLERVHLPSGRPTTETDEAIVRCDLTGRCELTTPIRSHDWSVDGGGPYALQ